MGGGMNGMALLQALQRMQQGGAQGNPGTGQPPGPQVNFMDALAAAAQDQRQGTGPTPFSWLMQFLGRQ